MTPLRKVRVHCLGCGKQFYLAEGVGDADSAAFAMTANDFAEAARRTRSLRCPNGHHAATTWERWDRSARDVAS